MADDVPCCEHKFFVFVGIVVGLLTFAGLMAGLTLGHMSLGLVDLEVLIKSGLPQDRIHAAKIFLVVKNQHLLRCTLLTGNSLAMESLRIFFDKLVCPWAAILISILPQAICTRYGSSVGATMASFVQILLWFFYPVAYPISKVKKLLTVDPEDTVPLRKMMVRKIPQVSENMPFYDILNEFQKGHNHIAVVYKDLSEAKDLPKEI